MFGNLHTLHTTGFVKREADHSLCDTLKTVPRPSRCRLDPSFLIRRHCRRRHQSQSSRRFHQSQSSPPHPVHLRQPTDCSRETQTCGRDAFKRFVVTITGALFVAIIINQSKCCFVLLIVPVVYMHMSERAKKMARQHGIYEYPSLQLPKGYGNLVLGLWALEY